MNISKIKNILTIAVVIMTLAGTLFAIEKYFAKTSDVDTSIKILENKDNKLEERLDINIVDDQIFYQQQQVYRIKDLATLERKEKEMTHIEKELLKESQNRLEELKEKRKKKIEQYENKKNNFN
ncbi:MAG TPA: hypothetical protein VMZ91_05025 [Candidatus Paceibacterota bacterium]|nr:hypothetical protein [Candidatus Paceibacterota bacterium]